MISPERAAEILRLYHAEKWRVGTLARQLGVHHNTVRRGRSGSCVRARRPTCASIATATPSRTPWCVSRSPWWPRDTVRVLEDGHKEIACHRRCWAVGQTIEDPEHIAELVRTKRAARELKGRDLLRVAVPQSEQLFAQLARRGDNLGANTVRLLQLLDDYGAEELRAAVATAIERQAWGAGSVAHILEQRRRAHGRKPHARVDLPRDLRVRELRVQPHDLGDYDALIDKQDDDPSH